jgi:hypothetical protein
MRGGGGLRAPCRPGDLDLLVSGRESMPADDTNVTQAVGPDIAQKQNGV